MSGSLILHCLYICHALLAQQMTVVALWKIFFYALSCHIKMNFFSQFSILSNFIIITQIFSSHRLLLKVFTIKWMIYENFRKNSFWWTDWRATWKTYFAFYRIFLFIFVISSSETISTWISIEMNIFRSVTS